MQVPEFSTARLKLRPIQLEDIPSYERHFIDYEVVCQLSQQVPWPYPEDGVRQFLNAVIFPEQGVNRWTWGIFLLTRPHELIGSIDLWRQGRPDHRGFWLGKKFWGQGIMTEAVAPIHDYAFETLGFDKLILSNAVGNVRSRRVKEKSGARFIGTAPAKFVDPALLEQELWELSADAWRSFRDSSTPRL